MPLLVARPSSGSLKGVWETADYLCRCVADTSKATSSPTRMTPGLRTEQSRDNYPVELFDDSFDHVDVLFLGVGIPRGHDTSRADTMAPDEERTDLQILTGSGSLREPLHTTNNDVGAESAAITFHVLNGTVRGNGEE